MFVYSQICTKFLVLIKLKTFPFPTFLFVSDRNVAVVYCWLTKVEKQVVPFLLSSHKQKCFCKYGEDVRNDKSVQYIHMIQPYKMSSLFGDSGERGVEKPRFQSEGLEGGCDYRAKA